MPTIATSSLPMATRSKFQNGEEFLHSLGDVPMSRVMWDPLPGTATEADLLLLIERENRLCELVDGTLVKKPVGYEESLIALAIASALRTFVRAGKLGIVSGPDATLRMASGSIRLPDVSFVSAADLPGGKRPRGKVPTLPPTIAVEVISEANTTAEMRQKSREYFESGAKLVWLVYPANRTVAIYDQPSDTPVRILEGDAILDGGNVLPGFIMPLADVFEISDFE